MNGLRCRLLKRQMRDGLCELRRRTIRCGKGVRAARFGSTAQKTLAVPPRSYSLSRLASRPGQPEKSIKEAAELVRAEADRKTRGTCLPYPRNPGSRPGVP